MAGRPFIFRCGKRELILPVPPEKYRRVEAVNIEKINMHVLGDIHLAGGKARDTLKISCLLPANDYPFSSSGEPETYITQLQKWCGAKNVVRFIIGNTDVNLPCLIESVSYGEQDGTNDIYAEITLREYVYMQAARTQAGPDANAPRAPVEEDMTLAEAVQSESTQSYQPKEYDTTASVAHRLYGPVKLSEEELEKVKNTARPYGAPSPFEEAVMQINGVVNRFVELSGAIKVPKTRG